MTLVGAPRFHVCRRDQRMRTVTRQRCHSDRAFTRVDARRADVLAWAAMRVAVIVLACLCAAPVVLAAEARKDDAPAWEWLIARGADVGLWGVGLDMFP